MGFYEQCAWLFSLVVVHLRVQLCRNRHARSRSRSCTIKMYCHDNSVKLKQEQQCLCEKEVRCLNQFRIKVNRVTDLPKFDDNEKPTAADGDSSWGSPAVKRKAQNVQEVL